MLLACPRGGQLKLGSPSTTFSLPLFLALTNCIETTGVSGISLVGMLDVSLLSSLPAKRIEKRISQMEFFNNGNDRTDCMKHID